MSAYRLFVLVIFHHMYILHCRSCLWIYDGISDFYTWYGEYLPSNLHCPSVTPRTEDRCVSSVSVKFSKMSIYYCGVILAFLSLALYLVVQVYVMVGEVFLCVPTLGYGALILRSTLCVSGDSKFVGAVSLVVCSTLGGAPVFFRRD